MNLIAEHLAEIKGQISNAARKAGRDPETVKLLAVSKTFPMEDIREACSAGQCEFGEKRVQELEDKVPAALPGMISHLIGHLQTNKIKYVIDRVVLIHSIDSIHLAEAVNAEAKKHNRIMPVLVEVFVAQEES